MHIFDFQLKVNTLFDTDSIERILYLCEDVIKSLNVNDEAQFKIKSIVHELIINSLEHGYSENPGDLFIKISRDYNFVYVQICDEGYGIDLSKINLEREITDLKEFTPRGWGLPIVNSFSQNLKITSNDPHGTIISLQIPV